MQRRVKRSFSQQIVTLVGESLNIRWQLIVKMPEFRISPMFHSIVQRPSSRSRSASSANASSLPAKTSSSNWLSHAFASKSSNQCRNIESSSLDILVTTVLISSTAFIALSSYSKKIDFLEGTFRLVVKMSL